MATQMKHLKWPGALGAARRVANRLSTPARSLWFPHESSYTSPARMTGLPIPCHTGQPIGRLYPFHTSAAPSRKVAHNNEAVPEYPPSTDFSNMDMLGQTPVPATSVDVCMSDGFALNSGAKILDGSGALLVAGEAFAWRPWGDMKRLVNRKGQWEVPAEAFGLFELLWPRPDLLILGLGPDIRPLSPDTRRAISNLGMRVEILDTRNAASQYNLLATERGVGEVAAALIPIGWKEGIGAT